MSQRSASMQTKPTNNPSGSFKRRDLSLPPAEHYAALLAESQQIKGVSLGLDAWRRLKKNRVAMVSFWFILLFGAASLLTPLWPLQSPKEQLLERQLLGPKDAVNAGNPLTSEPISLNVSSFLAENRRQLAEQREELGNSNNTPDRTKQIEAEIVRLNDLREKRLGQLWHNPGFISRQLIQLRLAIWGDWCVPSILGTDELGQDLLARLFWGSRVSLMVGILATLVSLLIGVSYGAIAGYVGGWVDEAMMRVVDILYSIPFIFVVIFLMTFLLPDSTTNKASPVQQWLTETAGLNEIAIFYVVIGAFFWLTMARVVRGQIISLKNEQFVEAARTIGASRARIIFRHLVPNILSIVIVYLTLTIPSVILFEAFLSFLGLGVRPPDVSWGILANDGIKVITPVRTYWWLVVFPGLTLALTLMSLNFLGDGLRDALDPRMKNK